MSNPGSSTLPTLPAGTILDGNLNQDIEEFSDIETYIREFNTYVLGEEFINNRAPRDLVTAGVPTDPALVGNQIRSRITLSEEQRRRGQEALESFFGLEQAIFTGGAQANLRYAGGRIVQLARIEEYDQSNITAIIFLEILEALSTNSEFGNPRITDSRFTTNGNPIAQLSSRRGPGEIRDALQNFQDQLISDIEESIEERTLVNGEAVRELTERQQAILALLTVRILNSGLINVFYENIYQIDAQDSGDFISRFTNTEILRNWFNSPTSLFSAIIPKVRIFKEYNENQDNVYKRNQTIEFKFDNFVKPDDLENIATGNGRGGGVGIESFTWDFEGQNSFDFDRNIKANLKIFVQDLTKLFPEEALNINNNAITLRPGTDIRNAYIFELFRHVRGVASPGDDGQVLDAPGNEILNPYDYRIKVEVGWHFDNQTLQNLGIIPEGDRETATQLMQQVSRILDLTLEAHNLNFNQDGTITIDLTYRSALDSILKDPVYSNVLRIGEDLNSNDGLSGMALVDSLREEAQQTGQQQTNNCVRSEENGLFNDITISEDEEGETRFQGLNRERLLQAFEGDINNPRNIIANYNAMFNKLLEKSRIYVLGLDYGLIASQVETGMVSSAPSSIATTLQDLDADSSQTYIGSENNEEAFLRVVRNELTLQVLQETNAFRLGRLGPQGVQVLRDEIQSQSAALERIIQENIENTDSDNAVTNVGNVNFEPLSVLTSGVQTTTALSFSEEAELTGRNYRIYFTTLGDILNIAQEYFIQKALASGRDPLQDTVRVISGPYNFEDVFGNQISINLSNILIDIDSFRQFFTQQVIQSLRTNYDMNSFIRDLFNQFAYAKTNARQIVENNQNVSLAGEITFSKFTKNSLVFPENSNSFRSSTEAFGNLGLVRKNNFAYVDELLERILYVDRDEQNQENFREFALFSPYDSFSNTDADEASTLIPKIKNVANFFDFTNPDLGFSYNEDAVSFERIPPKVVNYVYCTAQYINQRIPELAGSPAQGSYNYQLHRRLDAQRGIMHLTFGERNSIIKNISFSKIDDPDLRTGRTYGNVGDTGNINFLREIYDVEVDIFGTPFVTPFQWFYLSPFFVGGTSDNQRMINISQFLGISGYYVVIGTSNSINANLDYSTKLKLRWQTFGYESGTGACPFVPPSLFGQIENDLNIEIELINLELENAQTELQQALDELDRPGNSGSRFENRYEVFNGNTPTYTTSISVAVPGRSGKNTEASLNIFLVGTGQGQKAYGLVFSYTLEERQEDDNIVYYITYSANSLRGADRGTTFLATEGNNVFVGGSATERLTNFLNRNTAEQMASLSEVYNDLETLQNAIERINNLNNDQ